MVCNLAATLTVAEIDTDAQLHATRGWKRRIFARHARLNGLRASQGIHRTREIGHEAVACGAELVAAAIGDEAIEVRAAQLEARKRRHLVDADQPAIVDGRRRWSRRYFGRVRPQLPVFQRIPAARASAWDLA